MSILNRTKNLLDLYLHTCGKSEVPTDFYRWSFISLVAACAGDKVSVRKLRGSPVKPDLFVFLIGPSAVGKGVAMDRVVKMSIEAQLENINRFQGDITIAALKDHMSEVDGLWLVMDELANDIGSGQQAKTFVRGMTKLYTADSPIDSRIRGDGKHTGGHIRIEKPFINWLAGTTWEWLIDVITAKDAHSGFGSRVQPIFVTYNLDVRYTRPIYPSDCDGVEEYIKARLVEISYLEGEFRMTNRARDEEDRWYQNRRSPEEESIIPWWRRGHDLVLKLAMIHSLMLRTDLVIRRGDIYQAIKWYNGLYECSRQLLKLAKETPETAVIEKARRYIQSKGEVGTDTFYGYMYNHGILKKEQEAVVRELGYKGDIEMLKGGYRWIR